VISPSLTSFKGLSRGLAVAAAIGGLGASFGQTTLVADSPFAPSAGSGAGAGAPAEAYELSGSTIEGNEVSVLIFERQAKHSRWIPVGGDSEGVHVISFDPLTDKAVVVIAGARKELAMRKAVVAALDPSAAVRAAPVAAPAAPQTAPIASAPAVAGSPAQEQREARMLVSDLLEIGVQQRKAYQEAKQRGAAPTPPPPDN
jgi:hypothetical protein